MIGLLRRFAGSESEDDMSTRGCIARITGPSTFAGRYHHWDSYPEGLGKTLYEMYNADFKNKLKDMLKYLIDEHPAGWSTLNGPGGHSCYCHGSRNEEAAPQLTEQDASDVGVEYVYAFNPETNIMLILSSHLKEGGAKMIGMFGSGAKGKDVDWRIIGRVDLNGPVPDSLWAKFGQDDEDAMDK